MLVETVKSEDVQDFLSLVMEGQLEFLSMGRQDSGRYSLAQTAAVESYEEGEVNDEV